MSASLVCAACGTRRPGRDPRTVCACGGLLEVVIGDGPRGRALRGLFDRRLFGDRAAHGSGVWRFRELLGVGRGELVTHPEGNTRLYWREGVSRFAGVDDLALKHEGENPTGSFKDRGMTVAITHAARSGASAVACASTGNTSASMAAYAAQAGLPALVFVPAGKVAAGKLAQALAYGARTLLVRGDFDACLRLVREASAALGITLLNSVNPWRIEGQKTIVLELLQQRGWDPPDWIAVPAGNLG
ncbi:MAG TPA: threonine synthase, partial [Vicinamibacteria bacterium]|nr:threonine synthase [Vicinamibacteria bacterium]